MKTASIKQRRRRGFTLAETLVVLAVVGVLAVVAIPQLSNMNGTAKEVKNQRNARSIVSVYVAASAAGATISGGDVATIVGELTHPDGVEVKEGAFKGQRFAVPGLSTAEIAHAKKYIKYDSSHGGLIFSKDGV